MATVVTVALTFASVLLLMPVLPGVSSATSASYTPTPASAVVNNGSGLPTTVTPVAGSSPESQDPVFDLPVASLPKTEFPDGTELHVVGVYKPALAPGEKDEPWWSKCTDHSKEAMLECHRNYAGVRTPRQVAVNLRRGAKPVVLVLMAYEPVIWKIDAEANSNIRKVILGGYHAQDVAGLSDTVPVVAHTDQNSTCKNCSRQGQSFYGYDFSKPEHKKVLAQVEALTGLKASSVQGANESRQFTISGSVMNGSENPVEAYVGQSFSDEVVVADRSIMLPEGNWQGLVHVSNAASSGRDEFLVLARLDAGQLIALLAVRVQTSSSRMGFLEHSACNQIQGYLVSADVNNARGDQSCFWVTHVVNPWSQPVFIMAADQLARMQVKLPYTVISRGFHQANGGVAISMTYYANPEIARLGVPQTAWQDSDWHQSKLAKSAERRAYVDGQVNEAKLWHQILRATRL